MGPLDWHWPWRDNILNGLLLVFHRYRYIINMGPLDWHWPWRDNILNGLLLVFQRYRYIIEMGPLDWHWNWRDNISNGLLLVFHRMCFINIGPLDWHWPWRDNILNGLHNLTLAWQGIEWSAQFDLGVTTYWMVCTIWRLTAPAADYLFMSASITGEKLNLYDLFRHLHSLVRHSEVQTFLRNCRR